MEAAPVYHLPPDFSTTPTGPFHLGTVLADFESSEQMRPLNRVMHRVKIPNPKIVGRKAKLTAMRKTMKSGEVGIWAKFMGVAGIGAEASLSAKPSDSDVYEIDAVETEYFSPDDKYISDCLGLPDVLDYLDGSLCRKPVFLITGLKIAKGVTVRMEEKINVQGTLEPRSGENTEAAESTYAFTGSRDVVVGIQCLKIYPDVLERIRGLFFRMRFGELEERPVKFNLLGPEKDYDKAQWEHHLDGGEAWVLRKGPESQQQE